MVRWRLGAPALCRAERVVAEECPVALTYNRVAHAVMLATPADLEDFAVGFSLAENVIASHREIEDLEIVRADCGIELRMWVPSERMLRLEQRRRRLAGVTGCGLCGLESLAEALPPLPPVPEGRAFATAALHRAIASLRPAQALNAATRAVHGAGFWTEAGGLLALREDVGRHNALDKLAGALARAAIPASDGVIVLTSRISVELVQKLAVMGAPLLVAVSAPTALALRRADEAGITVIGIARDDGFEVFTHPERVIG